MRLPDSITYVNLGHEYFHPIERTRLPSSLAHLDLGVKFCQPLRDWSPPHSLTHLTLAFGWKLGPSQLRLPPNLLTLILPREFNEARESLSSLHLPPRLHTLKLGGKLEVNELAALSFPHSLTSLNLGRGCNASLNDIRWPPHLTRLITGMTFDQPLNSWSSPSSLAELVLGDEHGNGVWNRPVTQLRLPSNLVKLEFGYDFNQPLTGLQFPHSLRVLSFGHSFNRSLARSAWSPPANLEALHLPLWSRWNRPWTHLHLPARLRKLTLP